MIRFTVHPVLEYNCVVSEIVLERELHLLWYSEVV